MKNRKIHVDIIRIVAIFFVLYVHTGRHALTHYEIAGSKLSGMLAFFMMCLSLTCNALFFMNTGAVLLPKKESISRVLLRFAKMAIVVVLFSLLQYAYNYYRLPAIGFRMDEFFKLVYQTNLITQYWFLYAYLALILILPFLRLLAQKLDREHFIYLLVLGFVLKGVLPLVEYFWENEPFGLFVPVLENIIFYPLAGYFIENNPDGFFDKKRNVVFLNVLAMIALIINVLYGRRFYLDTGFAESIDGMTMVVALAIFVDIRLICNRLSLPNWLKKGIAWCGSGVFGVCLLEPQVRDGFFFLYRILEPFIKWLPAAVVWLSASMFSGILIMNLLKKIPGIKKLF